MALGLLERCLHREDPGAQIAGGFIEQQGDDPVREFPELVGGCVPVTQAGQVVLDQGMLDQVKAHRLAFNSAGTTASPASVIRPSSSRRLTRAMLDGDQLLRARRGVKRPAIKVSSKPLTWPSI